MPGFVPWPGPGGPYSRLMLVTDSPIWVLAWEMRELASLARRMGVKLAAPGWVDLAPRQVLFFASHFSLLLAESWPQDHRVGTAYYHGRPGTGLPEFDAAYAALCREHSRIQRIQVSHTEMRDVILGSGIAPEKVFLIPIGINLSFFRVQTPRSGGRPGLAWEFPSPRWWWVLFKKTGWVGAMARSPN